MIDKAGHIAWAADAVAVFQNHCGTGDEHAIADLICDLGHLADERGFPARCGRTLLRVRARARESTKRVMTNQGNVHTPTCVASRGGQLTEPCRLLYLQPGNHGDIDAV
jgi:hypothetical protein